MTEKIIIDGVDVRNCNRCNPFHYDRGASEYPICLTSLEQWGGLEHYCNQRPNCYYKQLIRLEQENNAYKQSEQEANEIIVELKQKNEKLKIEVKQIGSAFIKKGDYARALEHKYKQLRSALEEIREIEILAYYPKGVPEEPLSQRDFILGAINEYEKRRIKILDKINEVLNG